MSLLDEATPEGMAFSDYVESVIDNPYELGSEEAEQYDLAMITLIREGKNRE